MQIAERLHRTAPQLVRGHAGGARARAVAVPVVAGAAVAFLFVLLMVGGFHAPAPHELPVAVAAPPRIAAEIRSELGGRAPGAFALHRYATPAEARRAVARGDAVGGVSVDARGVTVLEAGAQGPAAVQAVAAAFAGVATAAGLPARTVDVRPLPAGDSGGLSGFMIVVGITVASAVFAAILTLAGVRPRLPAALAALALFAALAGGAAALAADASFGAFAGRFWAVAGIAALLALAVSATVVALGRALGAPGLGLGALLAVLLSVSSSGSAVGYRFEPAFYRGISQFFPAGSAVEALRDVGYYGGAHAGGRLAVLAVWAAVAVAVLLLTEAVRERRPGGRVRPAVAAAE